MAFPQHNPLKKKIKKKHDFALLKSFSSTTLFLVHLCDFEIFERFSAMHSLFIMTIIMTMFIQGNLCNTRNAVINEGHVNDSAVNDEIRQPRSKIQR